MEKGILKGHLCALWSILVWGTTFVVTKVLLNIFAPIEILFIRFLMAWVFLTVMNRDKVKTESKKDELLFALAGLFGVIMYFIFENTALMFTTASLVAIVISVSPFFAAIIASFILGQKNRRYFYLGFVIAITGIAFVSLQDGVSSEIFDLRGVVLSCLAALSWACYSTITKKLSTKGINSFAMTRHIFFYALIISIPLLFIMDFSVTASQLMDIRIILSFAFLGLLASGICFVTWNKALNILGAVKTCIYIYLQPVVTVIFSVIFLKEKITLMEIIGIILIFAGLFISDRDYILKRNK